MKVTSSAIESNLRLSVLPKSTTTDYDEVVFEPPTFGACTTLYTSWATVAPRRNQKMMLMSGLLVNNSFTGNCNISNICPDTGGVINRVAPVDGWATILALMLLFGILAYGVLNLWLWDWSFGERQHGSPLAGDVRACSPQRRGAGSPSVHIKYRVAQCGG